MRKPAFVSHYLVLKDLLNEVDVRRFSDSVVYLTSRIENVKNDLKNRGLAFIENAKAESKHSHYKPYIIERDEDNIKRANELLRYFGTEKVLRFLDEAA